MQPVRPLKFWMVGRWRSFLSFWVSAYFHGQTVKFRGLVCINKKFVPGLHYETTGFWTILNGEKNHRNCERFEHFNLVTVFNTPTFWSATLSSLSTAFCFLEIEFFRLFFFQHQHLPNIFCCVSFCQKNKNNSPSTSNLPSWIPKKQMNRSIFRSKIVPRARLLTIHLNRRFVHLFVPGLGRLDWQTSNSIFLRCLDGFTPCGNMKVNMNFKRFYGHNFNDSKWFQMSKPWSNSEFTCFFTFWGLFVDLKLICAQDRAIQNGWSPQGDDANGPSTSWAPIPRKKPCTCQSNGIFSQHLYMWNTMFKNQ